MYLDASPQYAKNYFLSMFHPQFDLPNYSDYLEFLFQCSQPRFLSRSILLPKMLYSLSLLVTLFTSTIPWFRSTGNISANSIFRMSYVWLPPAYLCAYTLGALQCPLAVARISLTLSSSIWFGSSKYEKYISSKLSRNLAGEVIFFYA